MKNFNLKLGDLVSLESLEKPGDGIFKLELGAAGEKLEKVNKLGEKLSDFAGTLEDNMDVRISDMIGLVETMKNALKRELLPEKKAELLEILKKRFLNKSFFSFLKKKKTYTSTEGIKWEDVQNRLEANPEKMWSLSKMEKTGGEPDLVEIDKITGEYIFMDCSAESPKGRRNCCYDRAGVEIMKKDPLYRNLPLETRYNNAIGMAALMGVDILNEKEYRELLAKRQIEKKTWSWIKTPPDRRLAGVALAGFRDINGVIYVVGGDPGSNRNRVNGGWRAVLRV